jgi:hypothetical protein
VAGNRTALKNKPLRVRKFILRTSAEIAAGRSTPTIIGLNYEQFNRPPE